MQIKLFMSSYCEIVANYDGFVIKLFDISFRPKDTNISIVNIIKYIISQGEYYIKEAFIEQWSMKPVRFAIAKNYNNKKESFKRYYY
jgi:hypothetical protein